MTDGFNCRLFLRKGDNVVYYSIIKDTIVIIFINKY